MMWIGKKDKRIIISAIVKASASGPSTEVVTEETSVKVSPEVDAMTLEELITYTDEMLKASSEEDENSGYNLRTYDDRIVVEMFPGNPMGFREP